MSDEELYEADLARLIACELDPKSVAGQAALRQVGISIGELEGLRELADSLDQAAQLRDEIATTAADVEAAPGLESIEATIEGLAAQGQGKSWSWLWIAAGLLLILPLLLWPDREPKTDELLGNGLGQVQFVRDGSGQHGALEFELEKQPSGAGELLLLVYDAENPSAVPCRPPILLKGQRYSDPSEQQLWPRNVRVKVVIRRPMKDNEVVGSATSSLD